MKKNVKIIITTIVVATVGQYTMSMVNMCLDDYLENQAVRTMRVKTRRKERVFNHIQ